MDSPRQSGGDKATSDQPPLPPLIEPGLVWTCWTGDEGLVLAERQPPAEASFRWLHLDLWDQRSARWIAGHSGLPADVQALFLSSEEHPRVLGSRRAMAMVLPDFQREFDREQTERIGALHIAVRPGLMLNGRHHPLHTPDIFRHRAAQADVLSVDSALALVLGTLADSLAARTASVMS